MTDRFLLTAEPLSEPAANSRLNTDGSGAVVTFVGRVRASSRGHTVTLLEYEAYPEMVVGTFQQIEREVRERVAIVDIVIHHRIGALEVGEASVIVAVSAAHRDQAFDACRFAIDRLKQIAPIWKKEHGPDGAVWVEERP